MRSIDYIPAIITMILISTNPTSKKISKFFN